MTTIRISGAMDLEHSSRMRRELLDGVGRSRNVLVDMSGVTGIDSSGVASLVEVHQAAREKDGTCTLVAVDDSVMRLLRLARLDEVFTIIGEAPPERGVRNDVSQPSRNDT